MPRCACDPHPSSAGASQIHFGSRADKVAGRSWSGPALKADIAATATEVSYGPRTDIALIFRSPRRRERGVSRAPLARANTGTKTGAKMAHLAIAGVKNYRRLVEKTAFRGHSPGRAGGAYRGRRRCRARCRSGTFLRCRTPPAPLLLRVTGSCRLYPSATATRRRAGPGSSATPHTTCHRHTG